MPNFIYTTNIPLASNDPSTDQPNMKTNTNNIAALIAIDHIGFNAQEGGIHKQVTLLNQSPPGLGDGDGVLFAKLNNGQSWPYWQNALGSIQLLSFIPQFTSLTTKVSLSGGLLMLTGVATGPLLNAPTTTVTFPYGGFPTACLTCVCTIATDNNATIRFALDGTFGTNGVTKTQFQTTQTTSSHLQAIHFFAIGN